MLFAAGFGTRMKHLTANQPKPMIPVLGKPLIDHTLELARMVHPEKIVANLHYKPEILARHLAQSDVQTVLEHPDILDTGGGLRNALPLLGDGPVFTMNTDAIWSGPNPLTLLNQAWNPNKHDALLMCVPVPNAVGHSRNGDFLLADDGTLSRGEGLVYGGVQIIKTDRLHNIDQAAFSLNLLWDEMLKDGRAHGLRYPGKWCDVGRPEGVAMAEKLLEQTHV